MSAGRATVKLALSGDTLILRGKPRDGGPPAERQLTIANIQSPRFGREDSEPFAFEAREALRRLCVGKEIAFKIEHTTNTGREFGNAWLSPDHGAQNIAHLLVSSGWCRVKEGKESPEIEALLEAERKAQDAKLGIWGQPVIRIFRNNFDDSFNSRADFFKVFKGCQLEGFIEQVRDASTYRIQLVLPSDGSYCVHQSLIIMLSGIRAPAFRVGVENMPDVVEPFGEEAKYFVESRLLQRDVKFILEGQANQNFLATIVSPGNITEALLANGFAKILEWNINAYSGDVIALRNAQRYFAYGLIIVPLRRKA